MSKLKERTDHLHAIRDFVADPAAQKQQLIDYLEQQRMLSNTHQYEEIMNMPAHGMRGFIDFLVDEMHTTMWGRYDWATEMDEVVMRNEDPEEFHRIVAAAGAAHSDVQAVLDEDPEKGYKLVAKRDLPAGTRITYKGKVIPIGESDNLTRNYSKQVQHRDRIRKKTIVGDVYARDDINMAGFANDKDLYFETELAAGRGNKTVKVTRYQSGATQNNAELVHEDSDDDAFVNLLEPVAQGEEISVRYGGSYWGAGGETKKKGQK